MHQTLAPAAATPELVDEQANPAPTAAPSQTKSEENENEATIPPPSATPTVPPKDENKAATEPPSAAPTMISKKTSPSASPSNTPFDDKISHHDAPPPKTHDQVPYSRPHSSTSGLATPDYAVCSHTKGFIQQFMCKSVQGIQSHPIGFSLVFVFLFLLGCCTYRRACKRSRRDEQGEYRAVADQYDEVLFEESFDDQYSFSEDHDSDGSIMSDEQDDGEDDWAKGPNIELGGVHHANNDELTLEEMNG
jgi:hypothetical protein